MLCYLKVKCTLTFSLMLVLLMFLCRYLRSWRMSRALQLLWFMRRVNDIKLWQMETLKRDFRSLIETVRSTSPAATVIVSGPLPTYRREHERFSRLFALNECLLAWCKDQKLLFVNSWNLFWEHPMLFRADGLHPSRVRAELLSDNISRMLHSTWLVSQFSNKTAMTFVLPT